MLNQMLKTYLSVIVDVNPCIPVRCVSVTVYSHTPSYRQRAFQSEMQARALPHVQRLGCAAAVGCTGHPQNPGDNGQKNWQSGHLQYNRKEGNVLFNDALNTFYVRLYGVKHMVKDHSDSERGNSLPPHGLLFPISSKGSFICTITQTG